MLRQTLSGITNNVKADGVEDELIPLLAGLVEKFEKKGSGGTSTAHPVELNTKRYSVGDSSQKISCSFRVPHVKESVTYSDVEAVVVGKFDAHYDQTTKCDYLNLIYDKS
ncbi:hypothetical protein [Persephonella sp.]